MAAEGISNTLSDNAIPILIKVRLASLILSVWQLKGPAQKKLCGRDV